MLLYLWSDYIEPDLCLSEDGIFVAMHDIMLDDTTNVADSPQLADRKATKMVDGVPTTGFFVSDFMFSELWELRVKQRLSTIRTQIYDNIFTIPTLDEIMSLAPSSFASTNREINQGKF